MSNVNSQHSKVIRSDKHWAWYYDRLPKRLRKALREAQHNWSDMQVYRMWSGTKGYEKRSIKEIIEMIQTLEEHKAYDWMKT